MSGSCKADYAWGKLIEFAKQTLQICITDMIFWALVKVKHICYLLEQVSYALISIILLS